MANKWKSRPALPTIEAKVSRYQSSDRRLQSGGQRVQGQIPALRQPANAWQQRSGSANRPAIGVGHTIKLGRV